MASILITGASSGIGRQLALQLIQKNHQVWGIARDEEKLKQLAIDTDNCNFFYCVCDVCNPNDLDSLKKQMVSKSFYPDTLILNAGITSLEAEVNHNVNYRGVVNVWAAFKKDIQQRNCIVAISGSLFGLVPAPFNLSYSKSKLDALNFVKNLSAEKENANIQFIYFVLGPIHTKTGEPLSFLRSLFIPTASKAAEHIIRHLGGAHLINIFPFSSRAVILLNSVLPKVVIKRFMTFLKR